MEKMSGSLLFNMRLCQRWRFTRAEIKPMAVSWGSNPPSTTGIWALKFCVNSCGTFFSRMRTYRPWRKPSCCCLAISPSSENSCLLRSFWSATIFFAVLRNSAAASSVSSPLSISSSSSPSPPPRLPFLPFLFFFVPWPLPRGASSSSSSSFYIMK